jgi:general secretion pathway protein F
MRFQYQALAADGQTLTGHVDAASSREAYRGLVDRGIQPTSIAPAVADGQSGWRWRRRNPRRSDYLHILKELHVLVNGGIPVAEAVAALAESATHPALVAAFSLLHAGLRHGERFPTIFARAFSIFPPFIHRIIETGDLSGRLSEALADAAAEVERDDRFRSELRNSIVYPIFLSVAGLSAIIFMFVFVVPRFAAMFRGKYDQLPWLSYIVIAGGMWVRGHLLMGTLTLGALGIAIAYAFQQAELRERLRDGLTRLPYLGHWLAEIETARWAAVLARLLENRVPLMPALDLARRSLRGGEVQTRMAHVERAVRTGRTLAVALDDSRILPPTALSLIRVGERSGNLAEMTRRVADIYDESVRNRVKVMLSIIEPAAIVLIGGVIGIVAVAIFLAITTINKVPGL